MAISSIIENIQVNNPKVMEEYVAAVEKAAASPVEKKKDRIAREISNPDELKNLMLRGIEKWGKQ